MRITFCLECMRYILFLAKNSIELLASYLALRRIEDPLFSEVFRAQSGP